MKCIKPITLKNGLVVPCGKCELCLSHRRDDWSIRLQLHADSYERMPLFIALTYNDDNLVYGSDSASLFRRDVQLFIKRYKDRFNLYDTDFTYFGCGEYGDGFDRPHYHILFFGDNALYDLYERDSAKAKAVLEEVWQKGFCSIGIAEWRGIHYVTKYCLKENPDDYDDSKVRPFTFCSHGIGMRWLKTRAARDMALKLERISVWRKEYLDLFNNVSIDVSNINGTIKELKKFFSLMPDFPDFQVILSNGNKVFLPRAIRRKLVGSFEHFKDSPLWLFEYYKRLLDSLIYYRDNLDFDSKNVMPMSLQKNLQRVEEIKKRIILNKHKKLTK